MTKDMTQGSPLKLILAFAVPLMLGSLFQQFYNLADTIIVGRFVGVEALAAVGSVGGLNYLVLGFVNGIACGFSIPISWTFGAKDYKEMRRYTANTVWLSIFFAVVLTIVTVALTRSVLASTAVGVLMTLTGGIVALPLIGIVLYQAAWLVITLFFPLMQR
mgnify:CR=1 FL=1